MLPPPAGAFLSFPVQDRRVPIPAVRPQAIRRARPSVVTAEGGDVKLCAQLALAVQVGTGINQELGHTGLSGAATACSGLSHRHLRPKIVIISKYHKTGHTAISAGCDFAIELRLL